MEKEFLIDFVKRKKENGTADLEQVSDSGEIVGFTTDDSYYVEGIKTVSGIRCIVARSSRLSGGEPLNTEFYLPLEQENLEYRTKE